MRLTTEALVALKTMAAEMPNKAQGDIVSEAIIEKFYRVAMAPVIRFGTLAPEELPYLRLETALGEQRLREYKREVLRVRPLDKAQAEMLSAVVAKVETELAEYTKLRLALAKIGRMGSELTADDVQKIRTMISMAERIKKASKTLTAEQTDALEMGIKVLKGFLLD